MKKAFILFFLVCSSLYGAGDDVVGFWNTINEKTGKAESVIGIYEKNGKVYGRIIATYGLDGTIKETIDNPLERAPGVEGNPFYSGLDIIWDLKKEGNKYTGGKILDPEKGKVYDAEIWNEKGNLIVRGKIWVFGRNQTWVATKDSQFPQGFKKPDLSALTPKIPQVARTPRTPAANPAR